MVVIEVKGRYNPRYMWKRDVATVLEELLKQSNGRIRHYTNKVVNPKGFVYSFTAVVDCLLYEPYMWANAKNRGGLMKLKTKEIDLPECEWCLGEKRALVVVIDTSTGRYELDMAVHDPMIDCPRCEGSGDEPPK